MTGTAYLLADERHVVAAMGIGIQEIFVLSIVREQVKIQLEEDTAITGIEKGNCKNAVPVPTCNAFFQTLNVVLVYAILTQKIFPRFRYWLPWFSPPCFVVEFCTQ